MDQGDLFGPPPRQRHSPTSCEAAEAAAPAAATLRRAVWEYLRSRGALGATDEEGALALGMGGNTYRPRRRELQLAGLVADSGDARPVASGRRAAVWVAREVADGPGSGRVGEGAGVDQPRPQDDRPG